MSDPKHRIISSTDPTDNTELALFLGKEPLHLETSSSIHVSDVIASLADANIGLVMAGNYYRQGLVREAFRCALLTSIDFFRDVGAEAEQTAPFTRLLKAVDDLDRDAVDPAFRIIRKGGKGGAPPDSSVAWIRRAYLAFAVEMELIGGKTIAHAAKSLEKQIAKSRKGTLSKRTNAEAIVGWLKKFRNREGVQAAQIVFDTSVEVANTALGICRPSDKPAVAARYRDRALALADNVAPDARD